MALTRRGGRSVNATPSELIGDVLISNSVSVKGKRRGRVAEVDTDVTHYLPSAKKTRL